MDNLVEQYKEKINDLMNTNQTLLDKIEQLENELKLKQVKNENSEKEEKEKEQYLSKINLLERQLQNLRENFENEISVKNKLENKNKEYKLLLNSCLETFKKIKKMPKIKNNNNLEEFLISKLKEFFKEISIKNEEIQLNEK
jgi:predicted RNase H-like nuclease (RuvC/YqgF family)